LPFWQPLFLWEHNLNHVGWSSILIFHRIEVFSSLPDQDQQMEGRGVVALVRIDAASLVVNLKSWKKGKKLNEKTRFLYKILFISRTKNSKNIKVYPLMKLCKFHLLENNLISFS
jgi:hypothetical protein